MAQLKAPFRVPIRKLGVSFAVMHGTSSTTEISMSKKVTLLAVLVVVFIAGCANPHAKGTLFEERRISSGEKIAILWDLGIFPKQEIAQAIARKGVYGQAYENCTSAIFARTFSKNGQSVVVLKVPKAEFSRSRIDAEYLITLHNTSVVYEAYPSQGLFFVVEADLFEIKTGKKLWSVKSWLSGMPESNNHPAIQLVRGLAANGFLNLRVEDVSDYMGTVSASPKHVANTCPQQ